MRHVSRTHRVALDWLFDRINLEPKIQITYVDTKNLLADILNKGSFSRDAWNHLSWFVQHYEFLGTGWKAERHVKKRGEEATSNEGFPMAKPRPAIPAKPRPTNLVMRDPRSEEIS